MTARDKFFDTSETAYAVDRNGQIVVWNQAAEQTFGYAESEALGQQCWELLSGWDVFGNQSCCKGCPVRATAFDHEPVNRFQVDFQTATHERKRFTVRTLMLLNGSGEEFFVHLCQSESDMHTNEVSRCSTNHPAVNTPTRTLTPREAEVLTLLHKGMTVPEIAVELGISPSTVRNHTQHIFSKLHVHHRFEAMIQGRKLGLI